MYHKDPETDSARIVGFEVTPNRSCTFFVCFGFGLLVVQFFLFIICMFEIVNWCSVEHLS